MVTKEVHMSRDRDTSSHRSLWVMLLLLFFAGLFAFWFIREREH
jgi:hypothetical protein